MVEFGNTWDSNEEFDDILRILDFPMESLEGDELGDDWDIDNLQLLDPIPSNLIMGSSTIPNDNINMWPQNSLRIDEATGKQRLSKHVDTSTSQIHQSNKLANAQDSGAFKTQSPVSVLESSGSCLGGKGLSVKSNGAIPVRSRSKRVRRVGVNPWLSMDFLKDSCVPDPAHLKNASSHHSGVIKKCLHCQSTKTPQWREGPMGSKTLCNACGVRYRSGRLFPEYRPAKSPTFAPLKHSNSHKKVIEMRNKQPEGIIKITEATEQKLLSNGVAASTSHICRQNKSASIQETQSPVSVLESRSKCVRSAGVNPSLVAKETLQMAKDPKPTKFVKTQTPLPVEGSILAGESSPIEHDNTISVQSRKRVRPSRFNQSPELSTSQKTQNTRRSKKKPFQHPIKVENSADEQNASSHRSSVNRKCVHCASTKTPQWREGPMGLLLCNACGVRYKKGCLFPEYRPADSPTFVPSKHSNSHKKVIEMRNKAKQMEGKTAEPRLSPQTEFVPMNSFFFDYVNGN